MEEPKFYQRSFGEEAPTESEVVSPEVLMEKAKIVGLESVDPTGNYHPMGLAKRVAFELDRDEAIDDFYGAIIFQEGKDILVTTNSIPPMDKLRLIEKIREVPGVESYSRIRIFEKIENADIATTFQSEPDSEFLSIRGDSVGAFLSRTSKTFSSYDFERARFKSDSDAITFDKIQDFKDLEVFREDSEIALLGNNLFRMDILMRDLTKTNFVTSHYCKNKCDDSECRSFKALKKLFSSQHPFARGILLFQSGT